MQRLMGFREPIVMIGKRGRAQVGKPVQRGVNRCVPRERRIGSRVRLQIVDLPLVLLAHCSSGSGALSELAASGGGS